MVCKVDSDHEPLDKWLNAAFVQLYQIPELSSVGVGPNCLIQKMVEYLKYEIQIISPNSEIVIDFEKDTGTYAAIINRVSGLLSDSIRIVFPNRKINMLLVNKFWSDAPEFHVDSTFATVIIPINNAPTHLSSDNFVAESEYEFESVGTMMPLAASMLRMTERPQDIETSDLKMPLMLKGMKWGRGHRAAVHSPPSKALLGGKTKLATALIIDIS
jgi:hypothetical protein